MNRYENLKRWFILVIAVLVIIVMGITVGGRESVTFIENTVGNIITPVQKVFYNVGEFFGDKIRPIISIWELESENKELLTENERLNKELVEARLDAEELADLEHLKEVLRYVDDLRIDNYITSNVIAKDVGNWYNMFMIDAGSNDGINKNSTVMNGNGLVGLVYEVGSNWSKVVTIIDNKTSIGFEVLDTEESYDGLLHGSVDSIIRGNLFEPHAKVNVGNAIVTSGLGIYPKGILIGHISEVNYDSNNLLTEIVIEPSVNFRNINRVFIVAHDEKVDEE